MSTATINHRGAGPRHMPRRLSPRRTARIMGIRVTPRVHEVITGTSGIAAIIVILFDFDSDPTRWTPILAHIVGA